MWYDDTMGEETIVIADDVDTEDSAELMASGVGLMPTTSDAAAPTTPPPQEGDSGEPVPILLIGHAEGDSGEPGPLSKNAIKKKERKNRDRGLRTPLPSDNKGARMMKQQGWEPGKGLGKHSTGSTDNVPLYPDYPNAKKRRGDKPLHFHPATTDRPAGTGSAYSHSFSEQRPPWNGDSAAWQQTGWYDSVALEARGVGPQPTWRSDWYQRRHEPPPAEALAVWQQTSWSGTEDHLQGPGFYVDLSYSTAQYHTESYQHDVDMNGGGEEGGQAGVPDQQQAPKRKKKSGNPGAHKRWLAERMRPDDYTSANPKWSFWGGPKLGWSNFAKSNWDWLDGLYQEATDKKRPVIETLDVGGWEYEITMDPWMNDAKHPEACGFQVAKHANSPNETKRLIVRHYE